MCTDVSWADANSSTPSTYLAGHSKSRNKSDSFGAQNAIYDEKINTRAFTHANAQNLSVPIAKLLNIYEKLTFRTHMNTPFTKARTYVG